MSTFLSISWFKKHILAVAAIIGLVAMVTLLNTGAPKNKTFLDKDGAQIPIPFLQESTSLTGRVTYYGQRNGLEVYEVTYANGETVETFVPDRVYLVHIPNTSDVVDAPLDVVLTSALNGSRTIDYFGYKYSDAFATSERSNINASLFSSRFPAKFFASAKARSEDAQHGNVLAGFEQANGVIFLKTDGSQGSVRLDPTGSLYVFVVNETGGANLAIRRTGVCGNGAVEQAEDCDDGDTDDTDECRNDCTYGIPIPFGSGGGVLSVSMTGPTSVEKGESFHYVATIKNETNSAMIISLNHTNPFEDGFIFMSDNSPANCKEGTSPRCSNITLQSQETKTFIFPFSISQNAVCGKTTGSEVYVNSPIRPGEPFRSNIVYTTITCQPKTDVSVAINNVPSSIQRGEVITYNYSITNNGTSVATLVHTSDDVPNGLTFLPSQSDVGCTLATDFTPNKVGCNVGSLAPGASVNFILKFQTSASLACNSNITNTATVFVENDSDPNNNHIEVVTGVLCSSSSSSSSSFVSSSLSSSSSSSHTDSSSSSSSSSSAISSSSSSQVSSIGSSSSSVPANLCGNGEIDSGETCDDADDPLESGDGCSVLCVIEAEFRCTGTPSVCQSYLDFVKNLADINSNGTVTDNEALILTLDVAGAPDQPYATVSRFDIDNDGDVDNVDIVLILTQLDILAPL